MKKLSPPKIEKVCDLRSFRESHKEEISQLTKMLQKRGKELLIQASLADELRFQLVGDNVTFVVNQNINFSRHCIGSCRFCSYSIKNENQEETQSRLSLEEFRLEVEKAAARGCTEICIQGGLDPELDYEFYIDLLRIAKSVSPKLHIHGYSPSEIAFLSQISGETVEDVFKEL